MSDGWGLLGESLGGIFAGGDDAYQEGRLRTARTEDALAQAKNRALEGKALLAKQNARDGVVQKLIAAGTDPAEADLLGSIMVGEMGSDYNAGVSGLETQQGIGFRDTIADPSTPNDVRQANLAALSGKPFSPLEAVGTGTYTDITAPKPELMVSPVGEASIRADDALTNLRGVQAGDPDYRTAGSGGAAGAAGPDGIKAPSGYMLNPNFNPALPPSDTNKPVMPIPGGPNDPNSPGEMGMNLTAQFARTLNAAGNTALDLKNIMSMPSGATTGVFGGQSGAPNLLGVTPGWLQNEITSDEVQQYKAVTGTLGEQLSTIERMGMRGAAGLTRQFDNLALAEGDSVYTKMYKLAQMRQTVENGIRTMLSLNRMPPTMIEQANTVLRDVMQAVPFTPQDVLAFQNEKHPRITLGEYLKQRQMTNPVRPQAAPAGPSGPTGTPGPVGSLSFATEAEAAAAAAKGQIKSGDRIVVGGVTGTWH